MALTQTNATLRGRTRVLEAEGNLRVVYVDVTFDASYPTTGLAVDLTKLGLKEVLNVTTDGGARNAAGTLLLPVSFNRATSKLQAYVSNGASPAQLAEAPNTTNLSAFTARLRVEGIKG